MNTEDITEDQMTALVTLDNKWGVAQWENAPDGLHVKLNDGDILILAEDGETIGGHFA